MYYLSTGPAQLSAPSDSVNHTSLCESQTPNQDSGATAYPASEQTTSLLKEHYKMDANPRGNLSIMTLYLYFVLC